MKRVLECINILGRRKLYKETKDGLQKLGILVENEVGDIKNTSDILLELSDLWHEDKKNRYIIEESLYTIIGIRYKYSLLEVIKNRELIELLKEITRD